jgi:hypothetical protein
VAHGAVRIIIPLVIFRRRRLLLHLQCQVLRFNDTYRQRASDKSSAEFLMLAVAAGNNIYAQAYHELVQLVRTAGRQRAQRRAQRQAHQCGYGASPPSLP